MSGNTKGFKVDGLNSGPNTRAHSAQPPRAQHVRQFRAPQTERVSLENTENERLAENIDAALLCRRRDAAKQLAVSESQILKWERDGLLHPIRVPGIRAVRYSSQEVAALARKWIAESRRSRQADAFNGDDAA